MITATRTKNVHKILIIMKIMDRIGALDVTAQSL